MAAWMLLSVVFSFITSGNEVLTAYCSPLHLLFGLGLVVAIFVRRYSIPGLPLALIGICGFSVFCYFDDIHLFKTSALPLVFGFFAGIAATGLMFYEKQKKLPLPKFLLFLGDASYSIYLIHYATLSLFAKVVYRAWLRHPVPLWMPGAVLVVIALGSGIALHVVVERPLLRRLPRTI